jgi:LacI family kdg operon repressor
MGKPLTISDISKAAGVSKATVSYYLNGRYENMSAETRKRLETIIKEHGYRPNNLARSLKSKKSRTIGIIFSSLSGHMSYLFIKAACSTLDAFGYNASVFIAEEREEKEREYIQRCIENQMDGIILYPSTLDFDYYAKIHESGIPIVIATRYTPDWKYDGVMLNYAKSVNELIVHLRENGFERVALFLDAPDKPLLSPTTAMRKDAFLRYSREYLGSEGNGAIYHDVTESRHALDCVEDFMRRFPNEKKAVLAVNSRVLIVTLKALRDKGVGIPREMGVCGFAALDWTDVVLPSVTVTAQPLDRVGEVAANLMIERIRDKEAPVQVVYLETRLVRRDSTNLMK